MRVRIADTITAAAMLSGVEVAEIVGPRKFPLLVNIRAAVVMVTRESGFSFLQIAAKLNRDHTSLIHYAKNWDVFCKRAPWLPDFRVEVQAKALELFAIERELMNRRLELVRVAA